MNKNKKQKLKAAKQLQIWFMGRPKAMKEGLISVAGFKKAQKALENAKIAKPFKVIRPITFNPWPNESSCNCSECQPHKIIHVGNSDNGYYKMYGWLERKGFKKLGSGAYGVVFGKDNSDKVIKLIRDPRRDGWVEYVQWAKQNKYLGTFAPRVDSYKFIKDKDSDAGFGMAVMERLDKTFYHVPREQDAYFVHDAMLQTFYGNQLAAKFLALHKPGADEFIRSFRNKFGNGGDFHAGNWMTRKDGAVVLIDPISRPGQTNYKERIKTN